MALVLEIVLGLMILASFFVAYMSARTWRIYQVILAEFVFLGVVVFLYMGARTLATLAAWGNLVQQRTTELAGLERQVQQAYNEGGPDANGKQINGIKQLRKDLERLATDRGGVIADAAIGGVKDGVVQMTLKSPDHGLAVNSVVFAFDQIPLEEGGKYRGEFKVVGVAEAGPEVQIAPNLPLSPAETEALANAKGSWTLYMTMPIDNPAVFTALDEATRTALIPKESLAEFAQAERTLRDYETFFHDSYVQRTLLTDSITKLTSNILRTEAATKEAQQEIAYRDAEKGKLAADLEKFRYEAKAIAAYEAVLAKQHEDLLATLKATYLQTRRQAAQWTATQYRAAEEIDRRSGPAAGTQ